MLTISKASKFYFKHRLWCKYTASFHMLYVPLTHKKKLFVGPFFNLTRLSKEIYSTISQTFWSHKMLMQVECIYIYTDICNFFATTGTTLLQCQPKHFAIFRSETAYYYMICFSRSRPMVKRKRKPKGVPKWMPGYWVPLAFLWDCLVCRPICTSFYSCW